MSNDANRNELSTNNIIGVISSERFGDLSDDMKKQVLASFDDGNKRDGGAMGKFFGNKKENAAINIAAIICFLLILICLLDVGSAVFAQSTLHMELISCIIPVVSLALGFIFGKGGGRDG